MKRNKLLLISGLVIILGFSYLLFKYFNLNYHLTSKVNEKNVEIDFGKSLDIYKNIFPDEITEDVIWEVSDSSLVKIYESKELRAISNVNKETSVNGINDKGEVIFRINVKVKKIGGFKDDEVLFEEDNNNIENNHVNDKPADLNGHINEQGKKNKLLFEKSYIELNYNESTKLELTNLTNQTIIWKSSNADLLKVAENGVVTAIANKNAAVIVSVKSEDNYHEAKVIVKINPIKISTNTNSTNDTNINVNSNNNASNNNTNNSTNNPNSKPNSSANNNINSNTNNSVNNNISSKPNSSADNNTSNNASNNTYIKVKSVSLNRQNDTIYLNKSQEIKLTATISPSNATNKKVKWSSSNSLIATVDGSGKVTPKGLGKAVISAKSVDGGKIANYTITVRQKAIVVITASAGEKMNDYFLNYTSKNDNYYSKSNNTLIYIFKRGAGYEYQVGDGTDQAIKELPTKFSNVNYVDFSIFYTLTGNTARNYSCEEIKSGTEHEKQVADYNKAVNKIKKAGLNAQFYMLSHNPLNTSYAFKNYPEETEGYKIVYSTSPNVCKSKYRSAYKYWISNQTMKNKLKGTNIKFIDGYSKIVKLVDEKTKEFEWLKNSAGISYKKLYKSEDGLHWDESTTKLYMPIVFNLAGM